MTRNERCDGGDAACQWPFSDPPRLALPQATALIGRAAVQLDRYHARYGAHGALTPMSIIVSGDDLVTIRPPEPAASDDTSCRVYWSPQRRAGEPPRPSDDLYSLGVIARELLAAVDEQTQQAARSEVRLRMRVDAVLTALTSWSPAERPASGSEAAVALDRLGADTSGRTASVVGAETTRRQPPEPAWAAAHRVATARRAHRLAQTTPPRPARPARPRQIQAPLGKGHYPDMPLSTGWVAALILILCSVYLLPVYFMLFPAG